MIWGTLTSNMRFSLMRVPPPSPLISNFKETRLMTTSQQKQQQYRSKWIKIQNFLKNNTGYKIAGVARAGSTVQGGWTLDSDLDIRFAIAGDPSKDTIYSDLVEKLQNVYTYAEVEIGGSRNVINMTIGDLEFDIILLKVAEFDRQCEQDRLRRI